MAGGKINCMSKTLEERLNSIIDEKDEAIEKLQNELDSLKDRIDLQNQSWQLHEAFENDVFSKQMPFPRLEMRMIRVSKNNWYSVEWIYGLVYKDYADISNNMLRFVPFSKTTSSSGHGTFESRYTDGELELPYRDGVHIKADSEVLNLPAYIVCREKNICQKLGDLHRELMPNVSKMIG